MRFYVGTMGNKDVGVNVMLLGSAHDSSIDLFGVESPLRMQRAAEEEQPWLSCRPPLRPPPPLNL